MLKLAYCDNMELGMRKCVLQFKRKNEEYKIFLHFGVDEALCNTWLHRNQSNSHSYCDTREHARLFPGVVLLFQGPKQTCLRGYADLINGKILVKDIH